MSVEMPGLEWPGLKSRPYIRFAVTAGLQSPASSLPPALRQAPASRLQPQPPFYFTSGRSILSRSIGNGKMIVEFCSAAISVSVCR